MKTIDYLTRNRQMEEVKVKKTNEFSFALAYNKKIIKPILDSVEETKKNLKFANKYVEFNAKKQELAEKHAARDEQGNVQKNEVGIFIRNIEEFNKELAELTTEYKDAVDEIAEFDSFLNKETETEVKFMKVSYKDMPTPDEDDIIEKLSWMVKEFDNTETK